MLHKPSPTMDRLLNQIHNIPVIDCHEHLRGPLRDIEKQPKDPFLWLIFDTYLLSDLWAISNDTEISILLSKDATFDEKWQIFSRLWESIQHTAYARVTKLALKQQYGIESISRQSVENLSEKLNVRDPETYLEILTRSGIAAVITDVLLPPSSEDTVRFHRNPVLEGFLAGDFAMPENWYPVFNANFFHEIRHVDFIKFVEGISKISISSLEDYEEAVFEIIKKSVEIGVIGIKDWSAYHRQIDFSLPARHEAELLFNTMLMDKRNQLSWPGAKPLDDYLFHKIIRCAQELNLPVQLHTGHMAGIRQQVDKANAKHLVPVFELYRNVNFDLLHANWPYMEDILFIGKNYPNVSINLSWVISIDPLYCIEFLKRSVLTIPHAKIHGFGGDYSLHPEMTAAQLTLAREVIACALADLVEFSWLDEGAAIKITADWLYNNPNRFYGLNLPDWNAGSPM
jgi:hypothetical protein